ncbi:hypothetical protein [Nonomuraea africana]|uniref:Uncharacterized protein n=1 Tax=Nonomuraea africana TaxID=46171 RepID=A0ABR9KR17_9ACTN|nr:hypothetical protein [Nonomuraea africana]MBE1564191.1 hypothetical protein [Nonomuraea africana]
MSAYGGAVLGRVQEDAADATVQWGRKILQRFFGAEPEQAEVPRELERLIRDPDNADFQAALRVYLAEQLQEDPQLADDVRDMLEQAETATGHTVAGNMVTASNRGVAAGRDITGPVTTGDDSSITGG